MENQDAYVLVKIKSEYADGASVIEQLVDDVAKVVGNVYFEGAHAVVFNGGSGHYVRPRWAQDHVPTEVDRG